MGLVGGPHCVAMCGAACAGIAKAASPRGNLALLTFQLGRVLGYAVLGGVAAASMQGLGWLTIHSAALRPLWSMLHVAAIALGLWLLWRGQQPVWLERGARNLWQRVRAKLPQQGRSAHAGFAIVPLVIGAAWALLPCGLLYSALLVATLTGQAWQGAALMALFALGTAVSMTALPWLWLRLGFRHQSWGVRLAGLALALSSGWALWMGLVHDTAPWCVAPGA